LLNISFLANYNTMTDNIEFANFTEFYSLVVLRVFIEISGLFFIELGTSHFSDVFHWKEKVSKVRSWEAEDKEYVSLMFKTEFCNGTQGKITFSSGMHKPVFLVCFLTLNRTSWNYICSISCFQTCQSFKKIYVVRS